MKYCRIFFILVLMLTPPTTAVFLQQDFATGQSSANTQDTLCDSNQSNPLISGAIKQFQGDFLVECAANNVIVLLIPEVNSKWGFSAADYIMSRSNYTIEDVETFGLPGEANTRIIMSTK